MSDYSRQSDPDTSHEAAQSIKKDLPRLEEILLRLLRRPLYKDHGLTSEEAATLLNISRVTISPRFRPLANKGFIEDSGKRRKGESRRKQIVWKVKEENDGRTKIDSGDGS